jgi:hypothetical protein
MEKSKDKKIRKPREQKNHLSSFLITVNCQIDDKKFIPKLKKAYESFYDNITDYIKEKGTGVKIKSISSESTIERGEKRRAYHIHALVRIEHTSKIHLDLDKMRTFFNKEVKGEGKNYLDVKYVNDPMFNLRKYFSKEKKEDG